MASGVSVIIPAFNEAESIGAVVVELRDALAEVEHEILVIDDASRDATAERAAVAGAVVIRRRANQGYGAALKTGIRRAKYERIAILDGDGQHQPADVPRLLAKMEEGYDSVIGAREKGSYQYSARIPGKALLQWTAGFLVGERPEDVNSGLRVFRKTDVLSYLPLLPNGFSFTTTLTLAMIKDAFQVGSIPIQTSPRRGRRSTVSFKDGFQTLLLIVRIAALFNPLKVFLPVSGILFLLGFIYAVLNMIFIQFHFPAGSLLLMLVGVIIFFFGILADQLASIRRGK